MPQVDNPRARVKSITLQELQRRLRLGRDRSDMSPEEELLYPEKGAVESSFIPEERDFNPDSVGGMPTSLGIAMPTKGWNWMGKMGSKARLEDLDKSTSGGFQKILNMLKRDVRGPKEWMEVNTSGSNKNREALPEIQETVTRLMKQKAAGDTREALKSRADRNAEIAEAKREGYSVPELPKGGHYLGIEPLDDTIVKGASLHQNYNPLGETTASKFGALKPPHWRVDENMLQEAIEHDARARVSVDDLLSSKGLAPESMYVRTPKNSFVVQDKAQETLDQAEKRMMLERRDLLEAHNKDLSMPKAKWDKKRHRILDDHYKSLTDLDALSATKQKQIEKIVRPQDMHGSNLMLQDGEIKAVDTQGFLVPSKNPNKTVYTDEQDKEWMEASPIPNDSRRSVIFNRKK